MKSNQPNPERLWQITCPEEKLRLIAACVEDVTRLFSGQCDMFMTIGSLDGRIKENLEKYVRGFIVPELPQTAASYKWNGGGCPNQWQRRQIAQGFATYKSIAYALDKEYCWRDTCLSRPLTCEEGGELMTVHPVKEEKGESTEYWIAANPDGTQYTYFSRPVRLQWQGEWSWFPSERDRYIGEESTGMLMEMLGLPKLTWEDEPYKFTVLKPKENDQRGV